VAVHDGIPIGVTERIAQLILAAATFEVTEEVVYADAVRR
jgi:hypothetical protein